MSVAAVLVTLGRERALKLLARFEPDEVAYLGNKAGSLGSIDRERLSALTRTFERDFAAGTGLLHGGKSFGSILEETKIGEAPEAEESAATAKPPADPWEEVANLPPDELGQFLKDESPTLSAIVAGRLASANAAELLAFFEPDHRAGVMAAMASAKPSQLASETALAVLREHFGLDAQDNGNREAEARLAAMLSAMEPQEAEPTLEKLRTLMDADAVKRIASQIMRFEDIVGFDLSTRTAITEAADREKIALALGGSDPSLREALLEPMGQRARRMVESAIPEGQNALSDKQKAARQDILETIRQLVATGTITLPQPGE